MRWNAEKVVATVSNPVITETYWDSKYFSMSRISNLSRLPTHFGFRDGKKEEAAHGTRRKAYGKTKGSRDQGIRGIRGSGDQEIRYTGTY